MAKKKESELEVEFKEPDDLSAAFALIERKIDEGHVFTSEQKDICIKATLDALAPTERPWFFEIAVMNKLPLWATLWGQFRRCQEWSMAQAPICDPGWEGSYSSVSEQYRLGEEICPICEKIFQKENSGQLYCSNPCGAEADKRMRAALYFRLNPKETRPVAQEPQKFSEKFASAFPTLPEDESESVRLSDDVADV